MAEMVKNSFDALPDEILFHILGFVDGLLDRYNLAQVSHRFNRMVKNKFWRRSIYIETRLMDLNCRCRSGISFYVGQIMKEISESRNLKTITIKRNSNNSGCPICSCSGKKYDDTNRSKIFKLSRCSCRQSDKQILEIERKILGMSNLVGIFHPASVFNNTLVMISFSPQSENGIVHYPPSNTTSLSYEGKETNILGKFLKFLHYNSIKVELDCPITVTLLGLLGSCNNLKEISLAGDLVLPSHFDEQSVPRIFTKKLNLWKVKCTPLKNPKTVDIFFTDVLEELFITYFLMKYFTIENFPKCPNLKILRILMRTDEDIEDEEFSRFCTNIHLSALNVLKLGAVLFIGISGGLEDILLDSLNPYWKNLKCATKRYENGGEFILFYSYD